MADGEGGRLCIYPNVVGTLTLSTTGGVEINPAVLS